MHPNNVETWQSFYSSQSNLPAFNFIGLIVALVSELFGTEKPFSVTTENDQWGDTV